MCYLIEKKPDDRSSNVMENMAFCSDLNISTTWRVTLIVNLLYDSWNILTAVNANFTPLIHFMALTIFMTQKTTSFINTCIYIYTYTYIYIYIYKDVISRI